MDGNERRPVPPRRRCRSRKVGDEPSGAGRAPPGGALRVLISFSPRYATYGDALARGLRYSRPRLRAYLVPSGDVVAAVARVRPHLIVSDEDVAAVGAAVLRISSEPTEPSMMRVGETAIEVVNPSFGDLLAFVDEVERSVGAGKP